MEIYKNDIVYAYEYKNRNNIHQFDDLIKIKVDTVDNNGKTIIVSGETMIDENIVLNSNGVNDRSSAIVLYKKEDDLLLKRNKKYYISYIKNKKSFVRDVKEYDKNIKLMCLYVCLTINERAMAKLRITDICFSSVDEINEFVDMLKISHVELYDDKITMILNGDKKTFYNYEVYYDGKHITSNGKQRLFNYATKVKNPINETSYDYNKIFSMKVADFEVSYAKV